MIEGNVLTLAVILFGRALADT